MKTSGFGTFKRDSLAGVLAARTGSTITCLALGMLMFAGRAAGQGAARVDFAKDVMPILQESCVDCHGPSKQKAGMRLDRRSSALKPFTRRVVAGSSANSKVYRRLIGEDFGIPMPPKGPLRPQEIEIVKRWIDQGADWPETLANEEELPPCNPKAIEMVDLLHKSDLSAFLKMAEAEPSLLNARGPEGSTPFMYAVLYADTATLGRLVKMGADPNKVNDAKATALMWAARDLKKTRLLVAHGADVNAKSEEHRTPLMIAARRPGALPVVKFLLEKGANPNPNSKPGSESSPLMEALTGGDESIVELLLQHGADANATADMGLTMAATLGCEKGLELLAAKITDKQVFTLALQNIAVFGDVKAVRLMLDHGADVNAPDPFGRTPLMYAAISDLLPVDVVKLLIARGADVNAKSKHAKTGDARLSVLDIAKQNGTTAVVDLLVQHGARSSSALPIAFHPRHDNSLRKAVEDSLPLLQRADMTFTKSAGCTSCHNNSMTAMLLGQARKKGIRLDEETASAQVRVNGEELQSVRDKMHQGFLFQVGDNFTDFVLGYQLVGMAAMNYQPDLNTDAAVMLIQSRQKPNGEWPYPHADIRPPICLDYIGQTALAMRALQLYPPKTAKAACEKSVRLAAAWLAGARSWNNDDRAWRLTGLAWAGIDKAATQKALHELLAAQRPDGGWSDLPSMSSTPYATGRSLVSLQLGGLPISDPAYQRGVQFLLGNQQEDGSWHTKTRALGFQPYFDSGFPHEYDQWMSAASTSWAAMALTLALPEVDQRTARVLPR